MREKASHKTCLFPRSFLGRLFAGRAGRTSCASATSVKIPFIKHKLLFTGKRNHEGIKHFDSRTKLFGHGIYLLSLISERRKLPPQSAPQQTSKSLGISTCSPGLPGSKFAPYFNLRIA